MRLATSVCLVSILLIAAGGEEPTAEEMAKALAEACPVLTPGAEGVETIEVAGRGAGYRFHAYYRRPGHYRLDLIDDRDGLPFETVRDGRGCVWEPMEGELHYGPHMFFDFTIGFDADGSRALRFTPWVHIEPVEESDYRFRLDLRAFLEGLTDLELESGDDPPHRLRGTTPGEMRVEVLVDPAALPPVRKVVVSDPDGTKALTLDRIVLNGEIPLTAFDLPTEEALGAELPLVRFPAERTPEIEEAIMGTLRSALFGRRFLAEWTANPPEDPEPAEERKRILRRDRKHRETLAKLLAR